MILDHKRAFDGSAVNRREPRMLELVMQRSRVRFPEAAHIEPQLSDLPLAAGIRIVGRAFEPCP
jgi:hypothetical protein